jgi:hypothetical protein
MYQISKVYDKPAKVEAAILRLRQEGFTDDSLHVATPTSQRQEWVLTVHYVFGMGRRVTDILDRDVNFPETAEYDDRNAQAALRTAQLYERNTPTQTQRQTYATHAAHATHREPGVEAIADLSGPKSPGAISDLSGPVRPGAIASLSGHVSPGAISRLSRWVSPGAISRLSGRVSPGTISRLSRWVSPGAISRLSGPTNPGVIASMASGWYVSRLFGLPLLTRDSTVAGFETRERVTR